MCIRDFFSWRLMVGIVYAAFFGAGYALASVQPTDPINSVRVAAELEPFLEVVGSDLGASADADNRLLGVSMVGPNGESMTNSRQVLERSFPVDHLQIFADGGGKGGGGDLDSDPGANI